MKKTISILLAMVLIVSMTMSLSAATINGTTTSGSQDIITSETKKDGTSGSYWEVTYDAMTTLPWETLVNSDEALIEFSASTHLHYNEQLKVTVSPSDDSKMIHSVDSSYALAYTLKATDGVSDIAPTVLGNVETKGGSFRVDIPLSVWNSSPAGEYKDVITFSATVETV